MSVLDLQRKGQQIGRIRIGQQVAIIKEGRDTGKTRPAKLDTFRFTTGSRVCADAIAGMYGGDVRQWRGEWEIVTSKSEIYVTVPPRDQVVSQHYEMWNKGGCIRRCDSQREQISGKPCLCPHAEDAGNADEVRFAAKRRAELAKLNPAQACKLTTRVNVQIPDLPGLGVFRFDTSSYYAAVEIADSADLMQMARDAGIFLPAILRIDQRQHVADGKTTTYPVVVLEVLTTFRAIATGAIERAGIAAQLPPAPGEPPRAITAAPSPEPPPAAAVQPAAEPMTAQQIANLAAVAGTREEVALLADEANQARVMDDLVLPDPDGDVWEELNAYLTERWRALPRGGES